jgi:hypothetical protein
LKFWKLNGLALLLFEWLPFLSRRLPGENAGLLLHFPAAAATIWSWPPQKDHTQLACLTMVAIVVCSAALTCSLVEGGRRRRNIAKNMSLLESAQ